MRRLCWIWVILLLLVAALAPLLANDVPVVARVGGTLSFPAFADYLGEPPLGPEDKSWKRWWGTLDEDSSDWALMPLWPYGAFETDVSRFLHRPDLEHPCGNDQAGRDVLARLIHGTSTAIGIGLSAVLLAMVIGVVLGGCAGYFGGFIDSVIRAVIEVFLCFPSLLLVLAAAALMGDSTSGVILVMAAVFWTSFARIVRGEFLSLREREFVQVARGLGLSGTVVWWRHMLPSVRGPIFVTAAFCMAQAVVVESTLSFLGLGPGPSSSSWGKLLADGKASAHMGGWHLWVFPGLVIVATVICCHSLADRLRGRRAG